MKYLKAGVVGMGFMGYAHVEALRRLGNVEVAAITSGSGAQQRAEALGIEQYYTDYRDMVLSSGIDAIHICTPNGTHYDIARFALEHGVHVLCEKPFTVTIEEAKDLCALAKETGLRNAVNFHNRFYPMANTIRRMSQDGAFGDIVAVQGSYLQDFMIHDTAYSWRLDPTHGKTRVVGDIGSHWIDLAEFVSLHRIVAVYGMFKTIYPVRKVPAIPVATFEKVENAENYREVSVSTEDLAYVLFRFDHGAVGCMAVSQACAGKKNELKILVSGSKQSAEWNCEDCCNLKIGNADTPNLSLTKDPGTAYPGTRGLISYPAGHIEGYPDTFKQAFRQFYAAIGEPDGEYDFATFQDGLRNTIILDRIYESAHTMRWVEV